MTTVDDLAAPPSDFAGYYATGYQRLAAQLYAYLGDATEAEDLAQEAYLRAWRSWSKISQYDDPVGWVRHVAWNLATSRLRQLATATRFAARQPAPESTAIAALGPERVALVAALRQMPERQRCAIVMHYIADVRGRHRHRAHGRPGDGAVVAAPRAEPAGHLARPYR